MTLHKVQFYLDREGASDLVAELVMKSCLSPSVFMEAAQLRIALLQETAVGRGGSSDRIDAGTTTSTLEDLLNEQRKSGPLLLQTSRPYCRPKC